VNGPSSHPLFQYLKVSTDHQEIAWNFVKFLIVSGIPVKRYRTNIAPKKIEPDILKYLGNLAEKEL
jgi:glutathione peroxidase-family protein